MGLNINQPLSRGVPHQRLRVATSMFNHMGGEEGELSHSHPSPCAQLTAAPLFWGLNQTSSLPFVQLSFTARFTEPFFGRAVVIKQTLLSK